MSNTPYGMICPITLACNVLEPRWTMPILTELWSGSSRFNEIRRGVGNISTALLSKRLREMEAKGLIDRIKDPATGQIDYLRTQMAVELEPAMNALARWAQRHIDAELATCNTSLPSLMWKLRREMVTAALPQQRIVLRFHFDDPDLGYDTYWLLARPGKEVELCTTVPGFEVDLFVETSLASLSSVMLARSSVAQEQARGQLFLSGNARLARTMDKWLPQSDYAGVEGIAMRRTTDGPNLGNLE